MRYYKIIQGGLVTGVGNLFLKYNPRAGMYCYCEIEAAEAVQDVITEQLFHPDWLLEPPAGAPQLTGAMVETIGAVEFDELYAELADGEEIPVPVDPEPEPEPEPEPGPEPERPMTVQEMREAIAELTSWAARDNYAKGAVFVMRDDVYQATRAIVKGSEVRPGYNCRRISLNDII